MKGTYFFGDYCSGEIWALDGDDESGWRMVEIADLNKPLSSFGADAAGEVLVLTFGGPILRLVEAASDYAPVRDPRAREDDPDGCVKHCFLPGLRQSVSWERPTALALPWSVARCF